VLMVLVPAAGPRCPDPVSNYCNWVITATDTS
jgi:hypothetical protein